MTEYDKELCNERHKTVEANIENLTKRANIHAEEIATLQLDGSSFKGEMKNLGEKIGALTDTIKWFIGIIMVSLIGFVFYVMQNNIK